jgi:hypothetical protein
MPLPDEERGRLEQLEWEHSADDPQLARTLRSGLVIILGLLHVLAAVPSALSLSAGAAPGSIAFGALHGIVGNSSIEEAVFVPSDDGGHGEGPDEEEIMNMEEPPVVQGGTDADWLEQQTPVLPDDPEADPVAGPEPALVDAPLPGGSEADRMEQQLPAAPVAGEDIHAADQAIAEAAEADRLEQARGITGDDEDDYPHGAAD